jgi:serine/threonine protein kinase
MRLLPEITPGLVLPARLPRGFALGEHMVDGWLRDGGMAAIYRAHRVRDGRRVAVKLQLPSTLRDPSLGERFEREAEVLWRVRGSAHVIGLLDVGMLDDGRRYLVMEWVEGEDLEELLDFLRDQDQQLPVARACRIGRDVARGLAALHEHGVVHLDLKPSNVMIGRDANGEDDVVLVDFGIAADLREHGAWRDEALLGTAGFTSPQRARGGAAGPSCDVYSLGVLLFEALSGSCVPPDGWSPQTLPRVDALRHGVPPALAELVCLCMRPEASLRPASAKVAAEVLDAIVGALEASAGGGLAGPRAVAVARPGGTEVAPMTRRSTVHRAVPRGGTQVRLVTAGDTEVDMVAGLVAVDDSPPALPDEIARRMPAELGATESVSSAADTVPGLPIEDEDIEPTYELLPQQQQQQPEDLDDNEPTYELEPMKQAWPAAYAAAVMHGGQVEARPDAPAPQLEWLEREPRWWMPWLIAAGVLAVTGVTTAWLAAPDPDDETTEVTMMARATAPAEAPAPLPSAVDEPAPTAQPTAPSDEIADEPSDEIADEPSDEIADEPDAIEEPAEPVVASKPSPRSPTTDSSERAHRAQLVAANEAACAEARSEADDAKRSRAWDAVLQATAKRRCWSSAELRVARARLRVTAYAELGELERCVEEGARSRDREIAARTALCRKKLGGA